MYSMCNALVTAQYAARFLHTYLQHRLIQRLVDALVVSEEHLVEEAAGAFVLLQRRPVAQLHVVTEVALQRRAKYMCCRVPQHL